MSMIEKVARAIAETYPFSGMNYDNCGSVTKSMYMDNARAAIEAMRNVTSIMRRNPTWRWGENAEGIWKAGIDAALAEPLP